MARLDYEGVDDLFKGLDALEVDEIAPKMLEAAAPILQDEIVAAATPHYRKGSMLGSIKKTKVGKNKDGHYVTVRPTGKDSKGVRNMEKMAYLEFGTSKQKATPVIAPGTRAAKTAVEKTMKEVFEKEIKDLKL
ncbi:MAG: HK97 gp10 family phage protein [Eubacteriales bacterium]|nr:HK97 gp10 family phage protein [Eubacteriales bacterium]